VKIDGRGLAVILIAVGALLVGAYQFGSHKSSLAPTAAVASEAGPLKPGAVMPPNHPMIPESGSSAVFGADSKFIHFEIGNRNVKSILADGNIVWIGTSGGVIRYDAAADKYKVFNNHIPGILSNGVFHVSKLGKRILVGTYGGGLSVYDPAADKWHNINIPDGLADQFVYDVLQARNGDVWIATWSGVNRVKGGALDDPSKWQTFTVENTNGGLPNPWVYGLDEGKDGTMWFATEYGLARYKDGKWDHWQHSDGLGADFAEVKDAIQFTDDPGLASSHHAQQKAEQGLQGVNVAYNPNYIISMVVDNNGVVWCGTWGAGLARFDGHSWHNFTTKDGLPGNHIFMLYKDTKGRVWAGTSRGLARLNDDGKSFSVVTTEQGLFADNVFSMADAADGSVWVGSFGGVAHITPSSRM
jgi:ligand-binding sensor domain-containing protein